jgi:two-component system, sporulation sensor kinase A
MSTNNNNEDVSQDELIEKLIIERMGGISSNLAHDLRSPLQTIQNAIYLLEKTPDNPMLFDMIRQSLKQATQLLDSFRDYYKGHILKPMSTEFKKVIDLAFSDLEIPDNIEVERSGSDGVQVKVDPAKTALAIRHLLINGMEAMPEGGVLVVDVSETEESIILNVKDNGVGIPSKFIDSVFVPFESNKNQGKGLGVPICKRVIESHGGSLSFTSQEGIGTKFTIVLPR